MQKNIKKIIISSIFILVYVNLVPYVCRIWKGVDWATQYIPDKSHLVLGLLFFTCFASLPAVPLIVIFLFRKQIPITFIIAIIVTTALLSFWHHNYDLSSDAQAAIGLVFIPIAVVKFTVIIAGIIAVIELLLRKIITVINNKSDS